VSHHVAILEELMAGQEEWSDEQLFDKAGHGHGGATVEASRRLRKAINNLIVSIEELKESSDHYAARMYWLTLMIAVLTFFQLVAVVDIIRKWL
jgi:hypothetical protein